MKLPRMGAGKCCLLLSACALCANVTTSAQTAHFIASQTNMDGGFLHPSGLAVDARGEVYVVDNQVNNIDLILPSLPDYPSLEEQDAFSGLRSPYGIAIDQQGSLYITETEKGGNDVIREQATPTVYGYTYTFSVLPTQGLQSPTGIAVDTQGKVYIADTFHNRVVVETPQAGTWVQSVLPTSSLEQPIAVAVDAAGAVYVSDKSHKRVLRESPNGAAYLETIVADNLDKEPQSIGVDRAGNVYILASTPSALGQDSIVVEETPTTTGYQQSMVRFAGTHSPLSMAVTAEGAIYLASANDATVKRVPGPGWLGANDVGYYGTYAQDASLLFTFDSAGKVGTPAVLSQGIAGQDFTDAQSGTCNEKNATFAAGDTCSVDVTFNPLAPGTRYGAVILRDAQGHAMATGNLQGNGIEQQISFLPATELTLTAGLASPSGVAVDVAGNIFFADSKSGNVYRATRSGNHAAPVEIATGLNHPAAVTLDGAGNVYVAADNLVVKETPEGKSYVQTTMLRGGGRYTGIAVDGGGNLYLTAYDSGDVHKLTLQQDGSYVASALGSGIRRPAGVAVDGQGNVYVAETDQQLVYEEAPQADGSYQQSIALYVGFGPGYLAVDGVGDLYLTDASSGQVNREIPQPGGYYLEQTLAWDLTDPQGLAVDAKGNIYVAMDLTGQIVFLDMSDPPVLSLPKTAVGQESAGNPQILTVANIGNYPLDIAFSRNGNPVLSSGFSFDESTTCPVITPWVDEGTIEAGTSCFYGIDFDPVSPAPTRGSLQLSYTANTFLFLGNTANVELREQGILTDVTRTSLRVGPARVTLGLGLEIVVTVADISQAAVISDGGTIYLTDTYNGKSTPLNGGAPLNLINGKAAFNEVAAGAGDHTITAHYSGVNQKLASSTGALVYTVH